MILFKTTSNFRTRLQALLKVKKGVYAGVEEELRKSFIGLSMIDILNNRDMILMDDPLVVIKLRLPDHKHKLSKKDGYRLIYMAYRNKGSVVFLDIYPKNGPSRQLDIDDDALLNLIEEYNEESLSNALVAYDISC